MASELQERLISATFDGDRSRAAELIDEWAAVHGYERALFEIVNPFLERIGEMWSGAEEFSLAYGYIAAKIAEDVLAKVEISKGHTAENPGAKGPVVLGNIEDDYHPLGRSMVTTYLRAAGWQVYDLGCDVLPGEFVDKALEVGARVVGASAMMLSNAMNILKLSDEINSRGLKDYLQLAVGGAVFKFRPELVEEVRGDGTAKNAAGAPALMELLWKNSLSSGKSYE